MGSDQVYQTTREITTEECWWLDTSIPKGTFVVLYTGHTYGAIGDGVAVTIPSRDLVFTQIPRDAIK